MWPIPNYSCHLSVVEPITVELAVVNPLKVALVLRDLTLLWQFVPATSHDGSVSTRLSTDKLDFNSQSLSYSNDSDFSTVSVLCMY